MSIVITFDDLSTMKHESVTDYCRALMKENEDKYKKEAVEVYRDQMLCLTVNSVEEGAKLDVKENAKVGPYFTKYKELGVMPEELKARLSLKRRAKGSRADRTEV